MTNWWPMMRIACLSAARTTGSPSRVASLAITLAGLLRSSASGRIRRPVNINPQVDALTNTESLSPRYSDQLPAAILSAMSRSAVSASGIRSSASARHIRITPSRDARSYCLRNASRPPLRVRLRRTASMSPTAWSWTRVRTSGSNRASGRSPEMHSRSSARYRALIAAASGVSSAVPAGRTKAGAVGAGLADIGKRSSGVQLRGCALYQHGARRGFSAALPEAPHVIGQDARVIERELRRLPGIDDDKRAGVVTRHRIAARGRHVHDPDRVPARIAHRIRIHAQERPQFDFQTRLLARLANRGLLDGFADVDEAARDCPAQRLVAPLDQYDRPPGPVEELDDGVGGDERRDGSSHGDVLGGNARRTNASIWVAPHLGEVQYDAPRQPVGSARVHHGRARLRSAGPVAHAMIDKNSVIAANRFGLGARPGELEHIGADSRGWLKSQIARSPPAAVELTSLKPSDEILRAFFAAREERKDQRAAAKVDPVQKAGNLIRDALLPHYLAQAEARVRVAARTEVPFHERLVQFWTNHFAVSIDKPICLGIAGALENEAIRPHVTGHFGELLHAVEQHPAMLAYLDNQ